MIVLKVFQHLSFEELKKVYRKTVKHKLARKYLAILKFYERKTTQQVADELFVTPQIVRKWIHRWNEYGSNGLVSLLQSGRPSFLSKEEQAEIIQDILRSPRDFGYDYSNWMLKIIAEHVKRKYGIKMTLSGIWRILKRHDMTRLVSRPLLAKADLKKTRISWEKEKNYPRAWSI